MELHEIIRRVREDKGLTQQNIADELGVDVSTVIRWEKDGKIKHANLERIAQVLGVNLYDLFNYKENPSLLTEPSTFYKSQKKVSILVQLDGSLSNLNDWIVTLQKLNAAL